MFLKPENMSQKGAYSMALQTHETAPTRFVEANGIRYAYRSFGKESGVPLVFLQHFRGTMDDWDPAVVNGFAKGTPGDPFRQCWCGEFKQCAVNHLSRCGPRITISVPRPLPVPCTHVSRRVIEMI